MFNAANDNEEGFVPPAITLLAALLDHARRQQAWDCAEAGRSGDAARSGFQSQSAPHAGAPLMKLAERRKKAEETTAAAKAILEQEEKQRRAKTAKLRKLRQREGGDGKGRAPRPGE